MGKARQQKEMKNKCVEIRKAKDREKKTLCGESTAERLALCCSLHAYAVFPNHGKGRWGSPAVLLVSFTSHHRPYENYKEAWKPMMHPVRVINRNKSKNKIKLIKLKEKLYFEKPEWS